MTRLAPLLAAALLAPGGPGSTAPAPRGIPADTLLVSYVIHGLRVIQQTDTTTPLVSVRLYLLGGTQQLTPRTAGLEALVLRTSEMGTARFPGVEATRAMARTGAFETSDIGKDWSEVGFDGFAVDFDSAWAVFADRLAHPTLGDSAIELVRARLVSAANARYLDPETRLEVIAESVFFAGHPYALDPRGNPTSLAAITAADVRQYARSQLVTSRMLLVVVGNLPRAHLAPLVTATLGQLPAGAYTWTPPPPLPEHEGRAHWVIEQLPLPTTYLLGYCAAPDPSSALYWSFRLENDVYSSILFNAVRSQGLSYAAGAPYLDRVRPVAGFEMSTSAPDKAFKIALDQLDLFEYLDIGESDDGGDQFWYWKHQMASSYLADLVETQSTTAGKADLLARAQLLVGDYRHVSDLIPKMNGVDGTAMRNSANYCRTRIQYAYLGDTARMHGAW
ncbi:MAG TPA: insulinase family protein [Gemmatimonadales bacterium]